MSRRLLGLASCGPKQVDVPNVKYLESAEAEKTLTNAGLKLRNVTEREDAEVKLGGIVIEQSVKAGDKANEGSAVDIVISKGLKKSDTVKVPDLTGKTVEEAEAALGDLLLVPMPGEPKASDTVEPGKICGQSAAAGSELHPLDTVTYNVSIGKEKAAVPNVTSKTLTEARDMLTKAGFACDTTTSYSNTVPKDSVISQNAKADTQADKGSVVTLEISLGVKPPDMVTVPNIISYNLSGAKGALESAGLKYTYTGDETGTVVSTNPAPGTKVRQGSTVTYELKSSTPVVPEKTRQELEALDLNRIVWEHGLGSLDSAEIVQYEDENWYMKAVCLDTNMSKHAFYVATNGKVYEADSDGKLKQVK